MLEPNSEEEIVDWSILADNFEDALELQQFEEIDSKLMQMVDRLKKVRVEKGKLPADELADKICAGFERLNIQLSRRCAEEINNLLNSVDRVRPEHRDYSHRTLRYPSCLPREVMDFFLQFRDPDRMVNFGPDAPFQLVNLRDVVELRTALDVFKSSIPPAKRNRIEHPEFRNLVLHGTTSAAANNSNYLPTAPEISKLFTTRENPEMKRKSAQPKSIQNKESLSKLMRFGDGDKSLLLHKDSKSPPEPMVFAPSDKSPPEGSPETFHILDTSTTSSGKKRRKPGEKAQEKLRKLIPPERAQRCMDINTYMDNGVEMVRLGLNGTVIEKSALYSINWTLTEAAITRKLLSLLFSRDELANSSLSGKPSHAFLNMNKPPKQSLCCKIVEDMVFFLTNSIPITEKEIRSTITNKCADENKLRRNRLSKCKGWQQAAAETTDDVTLS